MNKRINFNYKNYRGEISLRTAEPKRLFFGTSQWHPEHQWLLLAYDIDKEEERTFALKDCDFRSWETFELMNDKLAVTSPKVEKEEYVTQEPSEGSKQDIGKEEADQGTSSKPVEG